MMNYIHIRSVFSAQSGKVILAGSMKYAVIYFGPAALASSLLAAAQPGQG